jgi:hypothetical protein
MSRGSHRSAYLNYFLEMGSRLWLLVPAALHLIAELGGQVVRERRPEILVLHESRPDQSNRSLQIFEMIYLDMMCFSVMTSVYLLHDPLLELPLANRTSQVLVPGLAHRRQLPKNDAVA